MGRSRTRTRRGKFAAVALVLLLALAAPLAALLSPGGALHDLVSSPPVELPEPLDEVIPDLPTNDLALARRLVLEAAAMRGLEVAPLPVPLPSLSDPLEHALAEWLFVVHGEAGEAWLPDALAQATRIPDEFHQPLALLLRSHAQATILQRDALDAVGDEDRARLDAVAKNPAALASFLEDPPAWAVDAAERVDLRLSVQAAVLLIDAAGAAYPDLLALDLPAPPTQVTGVETASYEVGPMSEYLPALTTADDSDGLALLDKLLSSLLVLRVPRAPAVSLTEQVSAIAKGLGSADATELGAPAQMPGPPGTSTLPKNLDQELGRLLTAALGSVEVLATHGPEALAMAHLARVRSMDAARPTLEAWARVLETAPLDVRYVTEPQLAAGAALDRVARVPRTPGVAAYTAFGLGKPEPVAFAASAPDDVVPALAALYDAYGESPPAGWQVPAEAAFAPLTPAQRAAIATMARGTALALQMVRDATARLTPADMETMHDGEPLVTRFLAGEALQADELDIVNEVLDLARLIDADGVAGAALVQAAAADAALALVGGGAMVPTSQHEDANCPSDVPFVTDCENGIYFQDPLSLVLIGGPGPTTVEHNGLFDFPPLLHVDLGGDDTWEGPIASAAFFVLRPVSVTLDLGGTDSFTSSEISQGFAAFGGVAMLIQAGGDTSYTLSLEAGQGTAVLGGVAALIDLGGNDRYRGSAATLGYSQPAFTGLGLLVDTAGDDAYATAQGGGRSIGGVFLDLGGNDTYRIEDTPVGVPLDQPVNSDYLIDSLFSERRDNAMWLDGEHALDPGFGLDVDLAALDHDGDLFPSLVETLAGSDANDPDSTPVTAIDTTLAGVGDEDEDGGANLLEEAAGTAAGNATEGPIGLPSDLPLLPEELAAIFRELRQEFTEAPPPNGLILDVRVPFSGRWSVARTCAGGFLGPPDAPFVVLNALCVDTTGPQDDELHDSDLTFIETCFDPSFFEGCDPGNFGQGNIRSEATLGLVALGDVVDSTYEVPYLLSVDLGGNDTYLEGAGGAITVLTEARAITNNEASPLTRDPPRVHTAFLPMTHLDLDGDDAYLGDDLAQGAGGGLLVDLNGTDTYEGGDMTQGALGGILLDDGPGSDVYRAGDRSQGAAFPVVGFASVPGLDAPLHTTFLNAYAAASARTQEPSILLDVSGDDTYTALDESQGYAVMQRLSGQDLNADLAPVNGTQLLATLLDTDGNDTYTAGAYSQAVAGPGGVALLVDRFGTDTYQAQHLVSQGAVDARTLGEAEHKGPGLAVLLDGRGFDRYVAMPPDGGLVERSFERQDKITEQRIPIDLQRDESSAAFLEALHIDIEGSERDLDGDGWPDSAETATGTDGDDPTSSPAPGPDGDLDKLLDLPQAGLAIGGLRGTTFTSDYVLSIDLGGANRYENNAGGPILKPLARLPTLVGQPGAGTLQSVSTPPTRHTIFENPVTAVFDLSLVGSEFHSTSDLSQAAALFTVGLIVTASGSHAYDAPQGERPPTIVPRVGRARLDGVLAPSEWPVLHDIEWGATLQEGHRVKGQFGLMHDGEFLYVGARIRDETADLTDATDEFHVYVADNHSDAGLFDRLRLKPSRGGTAFDEHFFGQGRNGCDDEWCEDILVDPNDTSVRMAYSQEGWTLEVARPLELPGLPRELVGGWVEGDLPEDVPLTEGNLTGLLLQFIDASTNETWTFPPGGANEDGALGFEHDRTLRSEARSWLPFFLESLVRDPPHLRDGPRAVQGAAVGGVSALVSLGVSGGHDRYTGFERAQGYGLLGGLGLLIDLAGSDTYEAREWAQGAGQGRGFGHLIDYDGNDIYRAFNRSQAYSPEPFRVANVDLTALATAAAQIGRVQAQGLLLDLGGYDHYEYEPIDAKHAFIALRAKSTDAPYVTYPDNDWVWTQGGRDNRDRFGEGGLGLDTFLVTRQQHVLGAEGVDSPPDPSLAFRIGDAHRGSCRFEVPYTADHRPFAVERGALVLNGTACVDVEVAVVPGRGFTPGRAELLRSGERYDARTPTAAVAGMRDDQAVEISRYRFTVDTSELDDGIEDWRIVATLVSTAPQVDPLSRPAVFLAQNNETVLLSNPPFPLRIDARARAFSTRAAIGHAGLPIDVKVSHDVSEDRLVLAGYVADRTNSPCPFDRDRLCNRYPLYLKGGERLVPEPVTEPVPSGGGIEETGWGSTDNRSDPVAGSKFRHALLADVSLAGVGGIGFVQPGDEDVDRAYLPDEDDEDPEFEGFEALGWARKQAGDDLRVGDLLVVQQADGATVAAGDLRLTGMAGRPPGTLIQRVDGDSALRVRDLPAGSQLAFLDADGSGALSPSDTLYLDIVGSGEVTPAVGDAAGDVRITRFGARTPGSFVLAQDADAGAALVVLPPELGVASWRAVDVDDTTVNEENPPTFSHSDLIYIDVDGDDFVSMGDVRLGVASHDAPLRPLDGTAARLVYYHQPYYSGDVQVHATLTSGRLPQEPDGEPLFTSFDPVRLVADQDRPLVAESVGSAKVSPLTQSLEPGGGDIPGWSTFWLPLDGTRAYPGGDPGILGQDEWNGLDLNVRTALVDEDGLIVKNCVQVVAVGPLACSFWDEQNPSIIDCSLTDPQGTGTLGLCISSRLMDTDLSPSRLELYVPTETAMFVDVNATRLDGLADRVRDALANEALSFTDSTSEEARGERLERARARAIDAATTRVARQNLEGDVLREMRWTRNVPDGTYALNLTAFDIGPKFEQGRVVVEERWGPSLAGEVVLLDATAPTARVLASRFTGVTQIDPLTEALTLRWNATDGSPTASSGIDELRLFAAPGNNPSLRDWKLVQIVKNVHRDGVEFVLDSRHDTYSFAAVAKDEVGNIDGVRENFWPTHKCPAVLPRDLHVWPPAEGRPGVPNLDEDCFETKADAIRAAFLRGLRSQISTGQTTVTTIDRSLPAFTRVRLTMEDGLDLPILRVGTRDVKALAAGAAAVVEACVSKAGPSGIDQVNFFLLTTLPDGGVVQRKSPLDQVDGECLDEHRDRIPGVVFRITDLANATADRSSYPEGFWTAGVEVLDGAGNSAQESFGVVYLDGTVPVIAQGGVQFPRGQTAVVAGQELVVDVIASDATGVVRGTLDAPDLNATGPVELRVTRAGAVTGRLGIDRITPDGVYQAFLNISDALGNTLVHVVEVPIDTTQTAFARPPEVLSRDPARAGDGVPVSTLHDGFALTFATTTPSRWQVLAGTNPARLGVVAEGLGAFNRTHEAIVTALAPSTNYFVRVEVFAPGGLRAVSELFQVRTGASFIVHVTSPLAGSALSPRSLVRWEASEVVESDADRELAFLVSVRRAPATPWDVVGASTGTLGAGSLALDLAAYPNGRTYALRVEALEGRERSSSVVEPLTLDKEGPVAVLLDPASGWTNDTRPQVLIELRDALSGLTGDPVTGVRVDGREATHTVREQGRVIAVEAPATLAPGAHTLAVSIADDAGNVAETVIPLNVDVQPPKLTVVSLDDVIAVRPGAPLVIELFGEDDGELALAEATLGASLAQSFDPAARTVLRMPAPMVSSLDLPLVIRLVDKAGNEARVVKRVVLDGVAPTIVDAAATTDLTSARLLVQATEAVRLNTVLDGVTYRSDLARQASLTLTGLRPGRPYLVTLTVADLAGNAVEQRVTFTTQPDLSPPTAVRGLAARAMPDGTVALSWLAADDNAGIDTYRVLRRLATGETFAPVAETSALQFADRDVSPGASYVYRVLALDLGGRLGPAVEAGPVTPVGVARLDAPLLAPSVGRVGDTFTFRVRVTQPGGPEPQEVALVLDGTRIAMKKADGAIEQGLFYQVTLPIEPHGPEGPHAYHFEAVTAGAAPRAMRLPAQGEIDGPLVTVLDDPRDATSGIVALAREPVIAVPAIGIAMAAGAFLFFRRRWGA